MNAHIRSALIAVALTACPTIAAETDDCQPLRILLVGDSTVCAYPEKRPERGWGQFIEERFRNGSVKVINYAASGRSTKTFMKEGRWKKGLQEKPDYVLIQFGH